MNKVIFWDFDGTLSHAPSLWTGTVWQILKEDHPDREIGMEAVRPLMRNAFPWHEPETDHGELVRPDSWWQHMEKHFKKVYERLGLSEAQADALSGRVRKKILQPEAYTLMPEAIETLAACREKGYQNWILSNHVPELNDIVAALGLDKLVEGCLVSAQIGWDKPNPRIYDISLREAGRPNIRYMVGDNPVADIDGASRADIPAIWMRPDSWVGSFPAHLRHPVFTCGRLADILKFIH